MSFRHFRVDRRGDHTATVTLDRPDRLNALSLDVLEELEAVAHSFRDDGDTRAVVFRGNGAHFSAGADLKDPRAEQRAEQPLVIRRRGLRLGQRAIRALWEMDQITVAALHGATLGGGACIATALDFRIGSEDCFVGYPEIDLGINLMWLGLPLCVHLIGPARAKRMVILGEHERAPTLLDWGFLDEMVPAGELEERSLALALRYAAKPPVAAQMIKRSVNQIVGALDEAVMHMDFDQWSLAASTGDSRRARERYWEKGPPPEWEGD